MPARLTHPSPTSGGGVFAPYVRGRQQKPAAEVGDIKELTAVLFARLGELEVGGAQHSYVRGTLVELNMALVRHASRRFRQHAEEIEDILQVGTVGLIKAVDGFDPGRGAQFVTYAMPTIIGEMRRYFRDTGWAVHVPRRLQELRIDMARATDRLTAGNDRAPTVAELAEACGVGEEEILEARTAAAGHTARSIDAPSENDVPEASAWAENIGDDDPALGLAENVVALKPLIARLPERDRRLLGMRFREEMTQTQIAGVLGVSQMQVSRLLSGILRELRTGLLGEE